jgi:cysteine synthase A
MPNWLIKRELMLVKVWRGSYFNQQEEGGFLGSIQLSEKMARGKNHFLPKHLRIYITARHETTGKEIWMQLQR